MSYRTQLAEIHNKRNRIVEQQRRLLNNAPGDRLNSDQQEQYNRMDAEFEDLTDHIEGLRSKIQRGELERRDRELSRSDLPPEVKSPISNGGPMARAYNGETYEERQLYENVGRIAKGETRDLLSDQDSKGGWTLPLPIWSNIIHEPDDSTFIRKLARHWVIEEGREFGIPILADDVSDPEFTSEIAPSSEDSTMDFAQRSLFPKRLTKFIKVSNTLMRQSAVDIGTFVTSRLLYKYRIAEEKTFLDGSGANQPLGIFTSSSAGVDSSRWISTGNTSNAIKADGVINCMYNLKGQYLSSSSCVWLLHRDCLKSLRKLKDKLILSLHAAMHVANPVNSGEAVA